MTTFDSLDLKPEIQEAIEELGFVNPTQVQEKAIPFLLESNRDLISLAQTGTGKTAAFGLPTLNQIDPTERRVQALVLCPTRELCIQISKDLENFSKHIKGLIVAPVYGGASIDTQIRTLKRGAQIIAATPGRMLDIMRRGKVDISQIDTVVLDEADEMLNMGFRQELDDILSETPETKKTLLFSATMPREVANIAMNYMHDPYEITCGGKNAGADTVAHHYYMVHARDRYTALKRIADIYPNIYGIVFCRTRAETKDVAAKLIEDRYNAEALHGDLSQAQRDYVMQKFRKKNLNLLVATDVAARGIDVNELTHVINYNLPEDIESYTHRSGRTGRAGKEGTSIAIVNMRERGKIRQIEKIINKKFEKKDIPEGKDICQIQLMHQVEELQNVEINEDQIAPFMEAVHEKLDGFSKEDIIKRFVSMEFNHFIEYYNNAKNINVNESDRGRDRDRGERGDRDGRRSRGTQKGYTRFFINIGKKDHAGPREIIGLINDQTNDRDIRIGDIAIKDSFSFFEVDDSYQVKILNSFHDVDFKGRRVNVEISNDKPEGKRRGGGRRDGGRDRRDGGFRGGRRDRNDRGERRDRGEKRDRDRRDSDSSFNGRDRDRRRRPSSRRR